MREGGCSLTPCEGVIHETAGSLPLLRGAEEVAAAAGRCRAGGRAARRRSAAAGSRCPASARSAARAGRTSCCRRSRAGCRSRRSSASSRDRGAGATSGRSTGSRASCRGPWRRTGATSVELAAHRVAVLRAACRPAGDEREVRRQAPGVVRLEHVVLEDEVARVVPVVRDLVPVVVAHHVGRRGRQRAAGIVGVVAGEEAPFPGLAPESRSSCRG